MRLALPLLLAACTCPRVGGYQGPLDGEADGYVILTIADEDALEVHATLVVDGLASTGEGATDCDLGQFSLSLDGEGGPATLEGELTDEEAHGSYQIGELQGSFVATPE